MIIPTEDNFIDWLLSGIKEYFWRLGYRVKTISIGQVKEKQCPVDRVLAIGNKIIGLQCKRPTSSNPPFKYDLRDNQHELISKSKWIFYCLPDFIDWRFQDVALFHFKFARASELRTNKNKIVSVNKYYRWGSFVQAIFSCNEGVEVENVEKIIDEILQNPESIYLSLNYRAEDLYIIRNIPYESFLESEPA